MWNSIGWIMMSLTLLAPGLGLARDTLRLGVSATSWPTPSASLDDEKPRLRLVEDEFFKGSENQEQWRSPDGLRLVAELAGGIIGGSVLGFGGYLATLRVCSGAILNGISTCYMPAVAGALVGMQLGINLGVWGGGGLMGGQGNLLATFTGWLVGAATVAALIVPQALTNFFLVPIQIQIALLPTLGAAIGYELSHTAAVQRQSITDIQFQPMVALVPSGAILGLGGRF